MAQTKINKENIEIKASLGEPIVEHDVSFSKDGNWIIHKTIVTTIKHKNYYKAMLENQAKKGVTPSSNFKGDAQ